VNHEMAAPIALGENAGEQRGVRDGKASVFAVGYMRSTDGNYLSQSKVVADVSIPESNLHIVCQEEKREACR